MKHLIVVSIILFVAVSSWAVARIGKIPHRSISQHVAMTAKTQLVFGIGAGVASLLAAVAVFGWMLPHYSAPMLSYILFGMLIAGFLIAACIPHIEGTWRGSVHNIAAWGIVYVIPVTMITVLFWPLSSVVRLLGMVLLISNSWLLFLSATRKELRKVFLYYQVAYIAIFYLFLVLLTYL
jgi:hypothetical protein